MSTKPLTSSLGPVLGIAFAYFATGKLGLLLAIPPGYATAVWLPSGIALAGLLLCGLRASPGVLLGSFLVNVGVSFDASSTAAILKSLLIATSIGTGATLQAVAGAFLVRRFVGLPSALDNEADVGKFLALGGPVSCLVNATWSVTTLSLAGAIPATDFPFNWWTWWVGDTIGVLLVSPLVLAWAGEPRQSWRRRRIAITVPLCIAFAVAVAFFVRASTWEQDRIRSGFVQHADSIGEALTSSVDLYLEVLQSIADFHAGSPSFAWNDFRAFVARPLERFSGFRAVSWNPRVYEADRAEYEAALQRDTNASTTITERNPEGQLIPAQRRSEYVSVRYIEPYARNKPALGFDVASDPVRADALHRARDSGKPAATARIELVQDVRREPGFLVFLPVYRGGFAPRTVEERRGALLGYATGVFHVANLVASSIRNVNEVEIELLLYDASGISGKRFLYSNRRPLDESAIDEMLFKDGDAHHIDLDVAGRRWILAVSPTARYLARHRGWQAWTVLAGGLLFAGLLGAFLLVMTGRAQRIEQLAARLQDEAADRARAEARVRRLNRLYAVQSAINSLIVRVRQRDELYRESCRIAIEAGKFRIAWVGVLDRDAQRVTPVAWDGAEHGFIAATQARLSLTENNPGGLSLVARAVIAKRAMIVNDVASDNRILFKQEHAERGVESLAVLPLIVSGEVLGVLVLHAAERDFFDEDEIKLLRELAGDLAFALDHLEKEERLNYLAYYDSLTGLANRTLLLERIARLVQGGAQRSRALALVLVDLERFKNINDSLGRQAGDELLREVADRIVKTVGDAGAVARVGADQFAVLLPELRREDEVARTLETYGRAVFGQPYRLDQSELRVSAKAGIALFPDDGADAETLFKHAEAAVKKAKTTGERYLFFTPQMTERVSEKLALESKLRQALENEQFVLHYQPKLGVETRNIAGLEALIRWQNSELGLVPPGRFIPLLEETGLILDVGSWAIRRASLDHRRWVESNLLAPRIAVNVSSIQLRQRDFVGIIEQAIIQGVAPTGIDLEITESVIMEDIEVTIDKLKNVQSLGVRLAIDDFGTGYSSLAYLAKLPVQSLKIDRSFIITMLNDPDTMTLVRTVIELAHSLRLEVVAEGVDSEEQANILRLLRCDAMQGYLFSKPLPFEDMTRLLSPKP